MFMGTSEDRAYLQAYKAIRQALRERYWPEGQHVSVARCAESCKFSPTPVREAMARLAGEGLLDERRGLGYFVPRLGPVELSELYTVAQSTAVSLLSEPVVLSANVAGNGAEETLFDSGTILVTLAGQTANSLLCLIAANLDARLAPVQPAEATMFNPTAESAEFLALIAAGDRRLLQRFTNAYYSRRRKAALEIARRHDSLARSATQ
ncbi:MULTISPECIES: GntR family transcriptional regulator [Sphingobium]|nr:MULTISPECIES: GntR family transcriptional regulator [Sphingobium]NML91603.1 GntR family transcriptional regulator [Sphingobium sp. TB-6]OAP30394.1 hypothetical protein A8O16_18885 [Sphingobium sp. 20006FA]KXU30847.1 hypothetical protein AXW74_15810 [Sphingobium sp. AM]KYC30673.1 hypothetical protein A0J57_19580 [Sphingobium sp. 22B]MCB4859012.1 GntR family transcriptional regulator [Sphingobium sp. PNB]